MNTNEHIENLEATRKTLVDERREAAKHKGGIKVRQVQENIDAVDRALADERAMANPPKTTTTTIK